MEIVCNFQVLLLLKHLLFSVGEALENREAIHMKLPILGHHMVEHIWVIIATNEVTVAVENLLGDLGPRCCDHVLPKSILILATKMEELAFPVELVNYERVGDCHVTSGASCA